MNAKVIDMSGKRFAAITAIRPTSKCSSGDMRWLFLCDCGNEFEANGYYARTGKIISCQKCSAERSRLASVKHGMTETPEFSTWTDIQTRCYNENRPEYKHYGGRGIAVCGRWLNSFNDFFLDMGPRPSAEHSIERNDVNGSYEPGNCRWATRVEQANNKRSNHKITINGVTKNQSAWAKDHGLNPSTITLRARAGKAGSDLLSPSTRGGTITFNGETNTYAGWSKKTGIKQSTIAMRINTYKWPIEKALTKGAIF